MESHEGWELDELFLAAVVFGIAGAFNYYRYLYKQFEETKRRARA